MKRLIAMLAAGLAVLALSACGKQETKPQDGTMVDKTMEQPAAQPADEQKPVDEKSEDAQKPSAQADQYNGMAQAKMDDSAADQDQDQNSQS